MIRAIVLPALAENAKAAEIKAHIYNHLPSYKGEPNKNSYEHIDEFMNVVETIPNMEDMEHVQLVLFPKTLKGKAKQWLAMQPSRSITSWDDLSSKFLNKFFPIVTTQEIHNSWHLHKIRWKNSTCWEQFNDELLKCPDHQFPT